MHRWPFEFDWLSALWRLCSHESTVRLPGSQSSVGKQASIKNILLLYYISTNIRQPVAAPQRSTYTAHSAVTTSLCKFWVCIFLSICITLCPALPRPILTSQTYLVRELWGTHDFNDVESSPADVIAQHLKLQHRGDRHRLWLKGRGGALSCSGEAQRENNWFGLKALKVNTDADRNKISKSKCVPWL